MEHQEMHTRIIKWMEINHPEQLSMDFEDGLQHLIEGRFFDEVAVIDLTAHLFEMEEWHAEKEERMFDDMQTRTSFDRF